MAVDQGIADAKGRLGAAHRFKKGDEKALAAARLDLEAAKLMRDIRKALDAGITPAQRREAARLLRP
jgi:hypothetical protein